MRWVIKLDYDVAKSKAKWYLRKHLFERINFVFKKFGLKYEYGAVFKTPHGLHVYMVVHGDIDELDLAFIQAVLGDDYKRAVYNYLRVKNKREAYKWNVLFSNREKFDPRRTRTLNREVMKALAET